MTVSFANICIFSGSADANNSQANNQDSKQGNNQADSQNANAQGNNNQNDQLVQVVQSVSSIL